MIDQGEFYLLLICLSGCAIALWRMACWALGEDAEW